MKREPYARVPVKKLFQALKLIKENGAMHGDTFIYAAGWDDARIAAEVGCSESSIAYRRKEAFGKLRGQSVAKPEANAAIDDLRARVETLERLVGALMSPSRTDALKANGTRLAPTALTP